MKPSQKGGRVEGVWGLYCIVLWVRGGQNRYKNPAMSGRRTVKIDLELKNCACANCRGRATSLSYSCCRLDEIGRLIEKWTVIRSTG